ncbi:hypothetical protein [Achromobacter arsenitoxydans]|uniref:hypothetical protein n=1 Tax=Achromobacter arsenitoxydans TaxID=1147684 RepID=UPI0011124C4B|nr:hypothetical protein [Achromobacter arsenitoxydans]
MTQQQLSSPEAVAKWLQDNPEGRDRKVAEFFFQEGTRYKQRKYWSAAAKSFGESAIRYPGPHVLDEYVTSNLKMLGEIRGQRGGTQLGVNGDMNNAMGQYQSALAADEILHSLSPEEATRVRKNIECLKRYLHTQEVHRDCQPMKFYGLTP